MKHLSRYNEEWNPFKAKAPILVISEYINSIKSPSIETIKSIISGDRPSHLLQVDGSFYADLTISPKKSNEFNLKPGTIIKYYGYKNDDKVTIIVSVVKFLLNDKNDYVGPTKYHDPNVGNIVVADNLIVLDRYGRFPHPLYKDEFLYDKETLSSNLTKFFEDSINELPKLLDLTKKSIDEKIVSLNKEKDEDDKYEIKVKEFINSKESIQDCFGDLIDISTDYKVSVDNDTITLEFDINGIKIKSSRIAAYRKEYIDFDTANIVVTNEVIEVFKAIQDAEAHLLSIDENIVMSTILRNNKLTIRLEIESTK